MTRPPEVLAPSGRGNGEGASPVISPWRSGLRWFIVAAFVLRAALGAADAQSTASDGMRSLPLVSSVSFGSPSPAWPLIWGVLALVCAVALALRIRIGWFVATLVTAAYVVGGIADVSALADTFGRDTGREVGTIVVELVVPLMVLAGLLSIRVWYLPSSRPLGRVHGQGVSQATPPSLDRWRRRF